MTIKSSASTETVTTAYKDAKEKREMRKAAVIDLLRNMTQMNLHQQSLLVNVVPNNDLSTYVNSEIV